MKNEKNKTRNFEKIKYLMGLIIVCLLADSGFAESSKRLKNQSQTDFSVSFSNCIESIGVGLVSTANAQKFVPAEFIPVGIGQPVTPLVVRTARCAISVKGLNCRIGEIVQIGAVIVPPDGTGDINNYTIFYNTSDLSLAFHLRGAGVNAQFVRTIDYHLGNDNSFNVQIPPPSSDVRAGKQSSSMQNIGKNLNSQKAVSSAQDGIAGRLGRLGP